MNREKSRCWGQLIVSAVRWEKKEQSVIRAFQGKTTRQGELDLHGFLKHEWSDGGLLVDWLVCEQGLEEGL